MLRSAIPCLLPALFALATPATAQAQDPGIAPVQALYDGLLAIMRGGRSLGFAGRAARIGPVIDRSFDLPLMTRLAVGPGWTGMSAADQATLTTAFRRLTIAQYARNFDGGTAVFAISPAVQARGADKLVRTTLTAPGSARTDLAYRLRQSSGGWRIVDVFYQNSISQLATRRADFARILASGGASALVSHLNRLSDQAAR